MSPFCTDDCPTRDTERRYPKRPPRQCITCDKTIYDDEPDPCLSFLPGVKFACCGHGDGEGYISFVNGVRVGFAGPTTVCRYNDLAEPLEDQIAIRNFPSWWERDYDLGGACVL